MKHFLFAFFMIILVSCNKDDTDQVDFVAENEAEITTYIATNKLVAQKTGTGLYYVIDNPGTGKQPTATSNVTVAYKGYFTNKNVFDKSADAGTSFGLQQVIQGWTEGIPYFKEGGSGLLLVPAHLGYGNSDYSGIPGGSVLIFEIKVIKVN